VAISWFEEAQKFKSPGRVVAAFLLRSRETQLAENRRLREERKRLCIASSRKLVFVASFSCGNKVSVASFGLGWELRDIDLAEA
jgi:hypothetical protein